MTYLTTCGEKLLAIAISFVYYLMKNKFGWINICLFPFRYHTYIENKIFGSPDKNRWLVKQHWLYLCPLSRSIYQFTCYIHTVVLLLFVGFSRSQKNCRSFITSIFQVFSKSFTIIFKIQSCRQVFQSLYSSLEKLPKPVSKSAEIL